MEDLIDRKALVEEWKSKLKRLIPDSDGMHSISLEKAIEALEKAPTVEAEPVRHGKWIEHKWAEESCDGLISNYECSECHSWFREWGHYCSDCGARMDGD